MPKVDVTWEQYEAISAILKAAHAAGTLKDYGSAEGLVKLVSEIDREQSDSHKRLKGIHLGHLTGLINSPKKVKAILGIQDPEDPQIKDWDMPKVDVTWEQYEAISAILKAAHAAGTLKDYGSAEGLVKLVSEIDREQSDSHKRLKGIHLGHLTGLINSPKKVKAILGIQDPEDPQIKDWGMPNINVTWEQYEAISAILKAAHAAGTLKDYGSAEGLVKLVSEIDREQSDSHKRLKGIHLGQLTGLINSPKKVKAILGIQDPEDPQIKDWGMPNINVTWEQYEAISAILKAAHAAGTLKDYGSAEGLVKLVSEIDREQSDSHKRLKGIHLGHLTGLINSPKKVKAILGIQDPEDPQIKDWDMPKVDVTWEQYEAISAILKAAHAAGTLKDYGSAEGLVKLVSEIDREQSDSHKRLKGIHLGQLTGLINSPKKVKAILGIQDPEDPQIKDWGMPNINVTWEQYETISAILKAAHAAGTLKDYGSAEGLVKLVSEIDREQSDSHKRLKGIHLGQLTGLINSPKKVKAIIRIQDPDH